jgi:hypothetical protein
VDPTQTQSDPGRGNTTRVTVDKTPVLQGLLRFDQLFGSAATQVPGDAPITAATLTLFITDGGHKFTLHRLRRTWGESATWASLGNGLDATEYDVSPCAESPVDPATGLVAVGAVPIDVTACVQVLQADFRAGRPLRGWVLLSTGGNGVTLVSSEGGQKSQRPLLEVRFRP